MKFWLFAGFFTGFMISSLVVRKCRCKPLPIFRSPERLYAVDDFIDWQRV